MVQSLDAASQAFVNNMNRIGERMARADREVSTGIRVSTVSDAPDSVASILQARADLASTQQIQTNLGMVKAETDTGEQALQSAISLVENARVLGTQGSSGTATPQARAALADEVGSILEQIGGLSRTTVQGRYIFSGGADQTPPYSIDLSAASPLSTYAGSAVSREIQHPNGSHFGVSRTAQEIFDSADPAQNVFTSLSNLRTALISGDGTAIAAAMPNIATSLDHLNGELAFYGNVQNRVSAATASAAQIKTQLQGQLSALQDADVTQSIVELNQAKIQQDAALQVRAKIPNTSLFNFLA